MSYGFHVCDFSFGFAGVISAAAWKAGGKSFCCEDTQPQPQCPATFWQSEGLALWALVRVPQ